MKTLFFPRSHVKARQYAAAKADLETRDLLSDRKLLVATYTNERELAAATAKLAQIPLDEQPDIDFYNLFTAIIDDLETNPTPEYDDDGNSKAAMPLPETVEGEALPNTKAATNIMAQSLKAQCQHTAYDRTPNYKTQQNNNSIATNTTQLNVLPNPAKGLVSLVWQTTLISIGKLQLYDHTGRLVLQHEVSGNKANLNIERLPTGLYICKVSANNATIASGKVTIIK
ncbi:MAG: T9SS type A sorting domain-containing protein [Sphingobacteriales bacterium]|nr:T9SS type A sorting domain-containing protein [Sphingobacteriales bacterium]